MVILKLWNGLLLRGLWAATPLEPLCVAQTFGADTVTGTANEALEIPPPLTRDVVEL